MKKRSKRLAVFLGVAMLAACQTGNFEVRAEEPVPLETAAGEDGSSPVSEDGTTETGDSGREKETAEPEVEVSKGSEKADEEGADQKTEGENVAMGTDVQKSEENVKPEEEANVESVKAVAESDGVEEKAVQLLAAENLRWEDGKAVFYNPNEGTVNFELHIYKDGKYAAPDGKTTTNSAMGKTKGDVVVDLNYRFDRYGTGTYTYQVVTYADGVIPDHSLTSGLGIVSEKSKGDTESDSPQFEPAAKLQWSNEQKGLASFQNTNEGGVVYEVRLLHNDTVVKWKNSYFSADYQKGQAIYLYFFEGFIDESGTYKVEVTTINMSDSSVVGKGSSAPYEYTKPEKQLSTPGNGSWNKDGIFSCEWTDEEGLDTYSFKVTHQGKSLGVFGTNYIKDQNIDIIIENGYLEFNMNEFLSKCCDVTPANGDYVEVQAVSKNIEQCINSNWSAKIVCGGGTPSSDNDTSSSDNNISSDSSSSSDEDSGSSAVAKMWKPATPDEIRRYAFYSREKVKYTVDAANAYPVVINNAIQGKLCFDSFEAVLGDYTIGRTYNITPSNNKNVYKMDSKARITLSIPRSLQAEGREYKMICVTEKGLPVVLDDLDPDTTTITFETDTYHAFALVYRNAAVVGQ